MKGGGKRGVFLVIGVVLAFSSITAGAQEEPPTMEPVVITATRTEVPVGELGFRPP
jgi:hypothetical protein